MPGIRPLSIGVLRREEKFLMVEVLNDSGALKGWRPLGGGIEFGESAENAVIREFKEEIGYEINCQRLLGVLENIYTHEGHKGHEIVFVYSVTMSDKSALYKERYKIEEGSMTANAKWMSLRELLDGSGDIYPIGLVEHLRRLIST